MIDSVPSTVLPLGCLILIPTNGFLLNASYLYREFVNGIQLDINVAIIQNLDWSKRLRYTITTFTSSS